MQNVFFLLCYKTPVYFYFFIVTCHIILSISIYYFVLRNTTLSVTVCLFDEILLYHFCICSKDFTRKFSFILTLTLNFTSLPACWHYAGTITSEWAVQQWEYIECTRVRSMLFSSIVLDYRIKVDSQDTEQLYPLILCFGFK